MQQSDVQQVTDKAWSMAQAQQFREANALFARLCEISPNDPEAWMRGTTQLELGDVSLAIHHLNRAIELDPTYADPCLHRGKLALNAGKLEGAWRRADQAVQLDPAYLEAWILHGVVRGLCREFDVAEHSARQALALNAHELSALTTLAHALRGQAKYAAAVDVVRQLLALNPQSLEAGLLLADSYVRLGKSDEARNCYQQYLTIHPGSVEAWLGLGHIDLQEKKLEAALASYRKVIALQPGNAQAHNNIGNTLLAMKDARGAETAFRKALSVNPHLAEAQANLGVLLQAEGKFGGARKCYEAALKQMPGNALLHSRLASILETLGHFQTAVEHCDQAAEIDPDNPDYRVKKARVLHKMGEHRQSCELLRSDVEQGSASVNAVVAFAQSLFRLDDKTAAVAWLERTLARTGLSDFERQRVHSALGMIHDKENRFDETFPHFAQANRLKGGWFDIEELAGYLKALAYTYTRQFLVDAPRGNSSTEQPIFIVGMPRSGTSLIEQILASHPAVQGVGELEDIGRLACELQEGNSQPGGLVNPAKLTQEKLAAMAVEWDQQVLRFYETRRNVATPSFEQVRQPMYKNSVGRWKNYEAYLAPLVAALR